MKGFFLKIFLEGIKRVVSECIFKLHLMNWGEKDREREREVREIERKRSNNHE